MKVSYIWLNEYFDGGLPEPEKVAELLSLHSYEVEKIEEKDGDHILDIDILPNRAHDSLSYWGVARELAVILDRRADIPDKSFKIEERESEEYLRLEVEDPALAPRSMKRVVLGAKIADSPEWLKRKIRAQGGKPKNNIIDITNLVMWETGQPVHAFDLDKIEGVEDSRSAPSSSAPKLRSPINRRQESKSKILNHKIIEIRRARSGERIITLDGEEYELDREILVIADAKKPLDIAGIKGSRDSGITANTKNIVLSICNFNPASIRKTSRRLKIFTDASKRFENGISPLMTQVAMERLSYLTAEISGGAVLRGVLDNFPRGKVRGLGQYKIGFSLSELNRILGVEFGDFEVENVLNRLKNHAGFDYAKVRPLSKIVEASKNMVGAKYKYGASITYDAPRYFDCSSFVGYIYAQAGISLPRMTADQYFYGRAVETDSLLPGDVIFSKNESSDEEYIERLDRKQKSLHTETKDFMPGNKVPPLDHNGIYLGEGEVAHASGKWHKGEVVIENLKDSLSFKKIVGARRFITEEEERYVVSIPPRRLDLYPGPGFMVSGNKEDLIEEIGRVAGFYKLESQAPRSVLPSRAPNETFHYTEKLKDFFVKRGFSEVITYSFRKEGEIELEKPLSEDKKFLRRNLSDGLREALESNAPRSDLLGLDEVMIFEIGKVYPGRERLSLAFASIKASGEILRGEEVDRILEALRKEEGLDMEFSESGGVFEGYLDSAIEKAPRSEAYSLSKNILSHDRYKKISPYPYVLRDIALWSLSGATSDEILKTIKESAGSLLAKIRLFDIYEKGDKISRAFRLVFQSVEKTLSDGEVNAVMEKIYQRVAEKGWEVR